MLNIGDKVQIIKSPYYSIKPSTMANIVDVKFIEFGNRWVLYILDNPQTCHSFREWELKKVDEKE